MGKNQAFGACVGSNVGSNLYDPTKSKLLQITV
jgi:hypothetical protein